MAGKSLSRSNAGLPDLEKITINLGFVDLGQIDLLVKEGFYSNRSDFIRNAIRQMLMQHGETVRQVVSRDTFSLGLKTFSRADLEACRDAGEKLNIRALGLTSIAHDVPAKLARDTIESLVVLGALNASPEVKAALADRLR
jgi:Arc/MetJ-type ribon-helix-helix transcriptional regulator